MDKRSIKFSLFSCLAFKCSLLAVFFVACNSEEKQVPIVNKSMPQEITVVVAPDTTASDSAVTDTLSSSEEETSSSFEKIVSSSSAKKDSSSKALKAGLSSSSAKKAASGIDTTSKASLAVIDSVMADTTAADTSVTDSVAADTTVLQQDTSYCEDVPAGVLCDKRDGHIYRMVRIGSQVWMAENLNYAAENSWCYKGKLENCSAYGRLYHWTSAMDLPSDYATKAAGSLVKAKHRGVCPEGWFLPTHADMRALVEFIQKSNVEKGYAQEDVGTSLKKSTGWEENDEDIVGTNRYGFGAKAAGYRNPQGQFAFIHEDADFWVAEESSEPTHAPYWNMYYANQNFLGDYNNLKTFAYSVRCIKK